MKESKSRAFRPWAENVERLEYAERVGLTISEVVNEVLKEHLKDYLKQKMTRIRSAMAEPIP